MRASNRGGRGGGRGGGAEGGGGGVRRGRGRGRGGQDPSLLVHLKKGDKCKSTMILCFSRTLYRPL